MNTQGAPGAATRPIRTLADLPFSIAARFNKTGHLRRCVGDGYRDLSSADLLEQVRALSLGLRSIGVAPGDRVAIVSESRPEWTLADLAVLAAGAITVPVYPTLSPAQTQIILADSGARFAVASDDTQVAKVQDIAGELPGLERIVAIDAREWKAPGRLPVETWGRVQGAGRARIQADPAEAARFEAFVARLEPSDTATIIYTSGTSGTPKGVVLTHHNILSNVIAINAVLGVQADDVALSFLPISHTFERTALYLYLYEGVTICFAESLQTIARDLARVAPTVMTGVPRVFEKFQAAVVETVARTSPARQRLFDWAVGVGHAMADAQLGGTRPGPWLRARHAVADRLVLSKIRERTGGRLRRMVSGSAPLARHTAEFFYAVGMQIFEGYGLTETAPVLTVNPPGAPRLGTVGPALPGVEIRIADDGEILVRGPNVMAGYYNRPDETREALRGGWFHTGDVGELDPDGYLRITDRMKDLIVTSGGKNIAPQPIELRLKASPLVAEAVIIGDRRNFAAALIVPDFAALEVKLRADGAPSGSREQLAQRPDVVAIYQAIVDAINADLAQFERIKRMALLPSELTIEGGELTPTLKLRRRVVEQRWATTIDQIYERDRAAEAVRS